jgi:hypothetical protein
MVRGLPLVKGVRSGNIHALGKFLLREGLESLASPSDKGVTFSPKRHGATRKGPVLWIGVDKRGYSGLITS